MYHEKVICIVFDTILTFTIENSARPKISDVYELFALGMW
jgi:hypothetical protein